MKSRLREPTDAEANIMSKNMMNPEMWYVLDSDTDKYTLVCIHRRRSRRRTIVKEK